MAVNESVQVPDLPLDMCAVGLPLPVLPKPHTKQVGHEQEKGSHHEQRRLGGEQHTREVAYRHPVFLFFPVNSPVETSCQGAGECLRMLALAL